MEKTLRHYMELGYQIVFDFSGIRAWYVAGMDAHKPLYVGNNVTEMFNSLNAHTNKGDTMMNDEYLEGRFAFRIGCGEDENPYFATDEESQRQYDDWQSGWYSAESERG